MQQIKALRERISAAASAAQAAAYTKVAALAELIPGAKTASVDRCTSIKLLVSSAWADLNKKGARLFVVDTVKIARDLVQDYAMLGRVEVAGRYQQVSALSAERYANVKAAAAETSQYAKERATATYVHASTRTVEAVEATTVKGKKIRSSMAETVSDRKFQVTAGSAASGAVAGGATGGAVGLTTGAAIGVVVGVVPAIFTFGLSIPIGAAIGGGAGLCLGTAAGATTGAIGGAATGRAVYNKKDGIASGASYCAEYVKGKAEAAKGQACASAELMKKKASSVKVRFVGGTGGTEASFD